MAKELAADLGGTPELSTPKLIGTNLVIRCRIRGAWPAQLRSVVGTGCRFTILIRLTRKLGPGGRAAADHCLE